MEKLKIDDIKKRIIELEKEIESIYQKFYTNDYTNRSEEYKKVEDKCNKLRSELVFLNRYLYSIAINTVFNDENSMRKILAGFLKNAKDKLETYLKEKEKIETKQERYRNLSDYYYGLTLESINTHIDSLKKRIDDLMKLSKSGQKQEAIRKFIQDGEMSDNAEFMRQMFFPGLQGLNPRQLPKDDIAPISPDAKEILMDISIDCSVYEGHQKRKKEIEQTLQEYEKEEWFELINKIIFDANGKLKVQLVNGCILDKYDIETADIEAIMSDVGRLWLKRSVLGFESINSEGLSLTCNPYEDLTISASPSLKQDAEQYNRIIAEISQIPHIIEYYERLLEKDAISEKAIEIIEQLKKKKEEYEQAKKQFELDHQQDMLKIKLISPMELSTRIYHPESRKSHEIEEYIKLVIQYHVSSRISDYFEKKYIVDMDKLARIPNLPQYVIDQINEARTKGHIKSINANIEKNVEQYGLLPEKIALQGLLADGVETTMSPDEAVDLIQGRKK